MRNPNPHIDSKRLSHPDRQFYTLISELPQLNTLFEMLARNEHPNFLTVMTAISEMVAFYVDSDLNLDDPVCKLLKRSQKKCLFCD